MEINKTDGSARIILDEKFDLTNAEKIKKEFLVLIEKDITDIILDFKKVEEIDSAAFGKILLFNKIVNENNGKLTIKNVNSNYIKKVFNMLNLDEILTIAD